MQYALSSTSSAEIRSTSNSSAGNGTAASSGSYETFNTFSYARQPIGKRNKFKSWIEKENGFSQFRQEFKVQTKCGEI